MQEYREMAQITGAEQPDFDQIWAYRSLVRNNAFVADTDTYGMARWEKVVGVVPLPNQTLGERRAVVLAKLNEQLPYSMRALEKALTEICGADNYTIELHADAYTLEVLLTVVSKQHAKTVQELLWRWIPCNLIWQVTIVWNRHRDLRPFTHEELATHTQQGVREDVL